MLTAHGLVDVQLLPNTPGDRVVLLRGLVPALRMNSSSYHRCSKSR